MYANDTKMHCEVHNLTAQVHQLLSARSHADLHQYATLTVWPGANPRSVSPNPCWGDLPTMKSNDLALPRWFSAREGGLS